MYTPVQCSHMSKHVGCAGLGSQCGSLVPPCSRLSVCLPSTEFPLISHTAAVIYTYYLCLVCVFVLYTCSWETERVLLSRDADLCVQT